MVANPGYDDLPDLMSLMTGDEKHARAATSTLDILWVLYDEILNVDPSMAEDRDRFLLSKGHGPMAFYAVLAAKGFISDEDLRDFGSFRAKLGHHPDRGLVPGVEISSGSLGHGLGLAVGVAMGLKVQARTGSVWVLLGDGELDEGSNHEAIAYAGRVCLDNLRVIVVDNASAAHGWPGGVEARFALEGWATISIDGRDHAELRAAFQSETDRGPRLIVAHIDEATVRH